MTYQRQAEWLSTLYMYFVMLTAAYAFTLSNNSAILDLFAEDWGINLTFGVFAALSFLGAIWSVILLLPAWQGVDPFWRRGFYTLAGAPILAYTIPVGYYILRTASNPIGGVIYLTVLFSFVVISIALYRPREEVHVELANHPSADLKPDASSHD